MPIKSTPSLFMPSISFSEIVCKIIDNAGCFENTPEKKVEKGACPFSITISVISLFT